MRQRGKWSSINDVTLMGFRKTGQDFLTQAHKRQIPTVCHRFRAIIVFESLFEHF